MQDRSNRSSIELIEEREYLLRSIEDLERERAAGDVGDDDYEVLRESYVARAAATIRELEALSIEAELDSDRKAHSRWKRVRILLGRRRSRRVLTSVGISCLVGALAVGAAALAGVRLPGGYSSGSVNLPNSQEVATELTDAQVLASSGQLVSAISLYNTVLGQVPNQPEALAYRGWLERLSGIAAKSASTVRSGDASIASAIQHDPRYADARGFEVIVLLEDDRAVAQAMAEYRIFASIKPSHALIEAIGPQMALAFRNAGSSVPKSLRHYLPATAPH